MTPEQAADGLIELVLPEGGRVLVDFGDRATDDPAIEADVIHLMLDAGDIAGDICAAIDDYAGASGLAATCYLGRDGPVVTIREPASDA